MVIGITGKKGSGKTVVSNFLSTEYSFKRHNFKDALIKEMKEVLGETLELFSKVYGCTVDDLFIQKPPIIRQLMQWYRTDYKRNEEKDYWVNKWLDGCPQGNVVADDVRFLNEAETIKRKGGVVIRIIRRDLESNDTHISETEQDNIEPDFTIVAGTGELDFIKGQLYSIIETISNK